MRKRTKQKQGCSCALCHPHKHGWESRWKHHELQAISDFEQASKAALTDLGQYLRDVGEKLREERTAFVQFWIFP